VLATRFQCDSNEIYVVKDAALSLLGPAELVHPLSPLCDTETIKTEQIMFLPAVLIVIEIQINLI
jgi:hypothetical protein